MFGNAMKQPALNCQAGYDRPQYFRVPGKPDREYFALCPTGVVPGTPALVMVHGISRNAIEHLLRFAPLARQCGVPLIAPLFERAAYGAYQQLVDPETGVRADLALFDILDHAAGLWPIDSARFRIFGFSGGSQFAHRFTFVHPHRVRGRCLPRHQSCQCPHHRAERRHLPRRPGHRCRTARCRHHCHRP